MNNQSPLVPQGSLLEQKNLSRARVKVAVLVVLAIHGIGLLALLMQGCKKEADTALMPEPTNNAATTFVEPTNTPPPMATTAPVVVTNPVVAPVEPPAPVSPLVAAPSAVEYKVAKGDLLSTIAKKFHVTLKQIMDANPGVDATKLQIGQTLHIPAPSTTGAPGSVGEPGAATPAGGQQVYTVKSGDSLIKIAGQFGTTVKALRSANNLTTDKIVVGQKLKVPAKVAAPTTPTTTPTETAPAAASVTSPTAR